MSNVHSSRSRLVRSTRVAPDHPRGPADQHPRRGRRRLGQDADARRAHGRRRRRGVYQIEHMAAVTFTRKAASELRGRFHLALEKQLESPMAVRLSTAEEADPRSTPRSATSSASSPAPFTPSAPGSCASGRSNPASRLASPSWTRCRTWSCASAPGATSSPARAPPAIRDMMALLDTGVRPNDLDSAFATICLNEDVEFPPGDAECPGSEGGAGRRSRSSGRSCRSTCPGDIDRRTRRARFRRPRASSAGRCAVSQLPAGSPVGHRGAARHVGLRVEDHPEVVGRHRGREEALPRPDQPAARRRSATTTVDAVSVAVAAVCLPAVRDAARRAPAITPRSERRRRQLAELRRPAEPDRRSCARTPQVRRALQQKYRHLFVDEFQDTDPVQAEIVFLLAADEHVAAGSVAQLDAASGVGADRAADWRTSRSAPARCSSSATRSSRSTASAAPTSRSTTSSATRFSDPADRPRRPADDELPVGAGAVRLGERGVRDAFPGGADRALAPVRRARMPNDDGRLRLPSRPLHADPQRARRERGAASRMPRRSRATSEPRSTPAPQVQRLPDPHAQEARPHRPVRERARGAEHPDRGERRRRLRRVRGGRGADGAAARARRSAGCRWRWSPCCAGRCSASAIRELFAYKQAGGWFSIFHAGRCDRPVGRRGSGEPLTEARRRGCERPRRAALAALQPVLPLDAHASRRPPRSTHPRAHRLPRAGGDDARRRRGGRPAARRRPRPPGRRGRRQPRGRRRRARGRQRRRRTRWSRCRSSPAAPTSCG